jgi:signal peptidase
MEDILFCEVTGFSMWPTLKQGDNLLIKRISAESLKSGDIVAYMTDNKVVCHRLVKKIRRQEDLFLHIRGDCSVSWGELIKKEEFVGKAVAIVKGAGIKDLTCLSQQLKNFILLSLFPLFGLVMKNALKLKLGLVFRKI